MKRYGTDEELFPNGAWTGSGGTMEEAFFQGIREGLDKAEKVIEDNPRRFSPTDICRIVHEYADRKISVFASRNDGGIGSFPDPVQNLGDLMNTQSENGIVTKLSQSAVRYQYFGCWSYPDGSVRHLENVADQIHELRTPVRYALGKAVKALLQLVFVALFALFVCNEYAAFATALNKKQLPTIPGLGDVSILTPLRDRILSLSFLQGMGEFQPVVWIILGGVIGFVCYKLFTRIVDVSERGEYFGSVAWICLLVGFPLFFAIYPHVLILPCFGALCVAFLIAGCYMLWDFLRWTGKAITRIFARKDNTAQIRKLTKEFEEEASGLHRYARLLILWAQEKNGGDYPKDIERIDKDLNKIDRIVSRYGIE